jgi:hypothetical protein
MFLLALQPPGATRSSQCSGPHLSQPELAFLTQLLPLPGPPMHPTLSQWSCFQGLQALLGGSGLPTMAAQSPWWGPWAGAQWTGVPPMGLAKASPVNLLGPQHPHTAQHLLQTLGHCCWDTARPRPPTTPADRKLNTGWNTKQHSRASLGAQNAAESRVSGQLRW